MKAIIYMALSVAALLMAAVLYNEIVLDGPAERFGIGSVVAVGVLASFIVFGLVSLRTFRTRPTLIQNTWLALGSVALTYLAVDATAGYLLLERLSPPTVPDAHVHHRLIPGTRSEFRSPDYHYVQSVNSLGLRGKEIEPQKDEGTYRMLMLGDSFTMGKGVRDDETFSALLERKMAESGRSVQVLNAGVDSYTPLLSYRQLVTRLGPLLDPDLVVLNFDMSDLVQEVAYRRVSMTDSSGDVVGFIPPSPRHRGQGRGVRRFVNNHLYLTRLAQFYVGELGSDRRDSISVKNTVELAYPDLLTHTLAGDSLDRSEQWQDIFDSILKIREYCKDHGIDFVLTVYPWAHQVSDDEWAVGRYRFLRRGEIRVSDRSIERLEAFALRNSIDLVNVFPAFRAYDGELPLYFDNDLHWTPVGHQLMADELARALSPFVEPYVHCILGNRPVRREFSFTNLSAV